MFARSIRFHEIHFAQGCEPNHGENCAPKNSLSLWRCCNMIFELPGKILIRRA
jgi:hypothetical protein